MDKNFKINSTRLLAVEGKDECNFFESLFKIIGLDSIQTVDIGGQAKFHIDFPLLCNLEKFSQITHLGFIRDAELNPARSAFDSICNILRSFSLPVPEEPNQIVSDNHIKIGIFIMPDSQGTGMLENLCLEAIKRKPIQNCIDNYIQCFKKIQLEEEKLIFNEPKARVQTYLSSRSPIVNRLGLGAQKGFWDLNQPCFNEIKRFLIDLFGVEAN